MLGHPRLGLAVGKEGSGFVTSSVIVVGLGRIHGREQRLAETVLGDEQLLHDEQEFGPYFADGMNAPVSGTVERLVCRRVDRIVGRISIVSNTLRSVGGPCAHAVDFLAVVFGIVGVLGDLSNDGREKVSPAFAHTAGLAKAETARVGRTACKSSRGSVRQLVNNNTGFDVSISVGRVRVPDVHSHSTLLAVRRGHKVGIVAGRVVRVLCIGNYSVTASTALAKVVHLEVARHLVESESVEQVVVHVGRVEQLGDSHVDILLRPKTVVFSILVLERHAGVDGSPVVQPVGLTLPVFMREHVVAGRRLEQCPRIRRVVLALRIHHGKRAV